MKNTTLKKLIALWLSIVLIVSLFAACGKDKEHDDNSEEETQGEANDSNDSGNSDGSSPADPDDSDIPQQNTPNKKPWITEILSQYSDDNPIYLSNFNEGYAFVLYNRKYFIVDQTGNIAFSTGEANYAAIDGWHFSNGLCFIRTIENPDWCLVNTKGNQYTADYFGGTSLNENQELLEEGYFLVDKVSTNFEGATRETAIYNTKLEQIRPYSSELYAFFHKNDYGHIVYNGYIITPTSRTVSDDMPTYHIETNTYGTFKDIPLEHKTDLAEFAMNFREKGMYRDDLLILDLSQYSTLKHVNYIDDLGIAIFENDEQEQYFSIIDDEGNLKFDPICYGKHNYCDYYINENVIITETYITEPYGSQPICAKVQLNAYNWEGELLGTLELTRTEPGYAFIRLTLGFDSILIKRYDNNTICYYDFNLKPMFPTE